MRNQTKIAVVASILVFIIGVSWYFAEWEYYSHRRHEVVSVEYEYIEKSQMEMFGSTMLAIVFCSAIGVAVFALAVPSEVWRNGI